uniref:Uncharacterized protein n=1 Tax=Solanum lycopersicum TaxID=4081 RepID=A0A3Q7IJH1_SOLLC
MMFLGGECYGPGGRPYAGNDAKVLGSSSSTLLLNSNIPTPLLISEICFEKYYYLYVLLNAVLNVLLFLCFDF